MFSIHHLQKCEIFHCSQMPFVMFFTLHFVKKIDRNSFQRDNSMKLSVFTKRLNITEIMSMMQGCERMRHCPLDNHVPPTALNYVSSVVFLLREKEKGITDKSKYSLQSQMKHNISPILKNGTFAALFFPYETAGFYHAEESKLSPTIHSATSFEVSLVEVQAPPHQSCLSQ